MSEGEKSQNNATISSIISELNQMLYFKRIDLVNSPALEILVSLEFMLQFFFKNAGQEDAGQK